MAILTHFEIHFCKHLIVRQHHLVTRFDLIGNYVSSNG